MRFDGIYLTIGPFSIEWDAWVTYTAYDAVEDGQMVFVREQRRKLIPKKRRIITYPENHSKRTE